METTTIGSQIRRLRKEKGVTQEQLAAALAVSAQAVSKWENNITLPDASLIPALASYFRVATDTLFGYRLREQEERVNSICEEAFRLRESDHERSRAILEEGLRLYPDHEVLRSHLLYVVIDPDERLTLAGRLAAETQDASIRYDALRFMAYAYEKKGEPESAKAALEQIPQLYFTQFSELAFLLEGEEKRAAAEKQKWISFETLLQMCAKLAEYYEQAENPQAAKAEYQRALRLLEAVQEEEQYESYRNYEHFFNKRFNHNTSCI